MMKNILKEIDDLNKFYRGIEITRFGGEKCNTSPFSCPFPIERSSQLFLQSDIFQSFSPLWAERAMNIIKYVSLKPNKTNDFVNIREMIDELFVKRIEKPEHWMIKSCQEIVRPIIQKLVDLNILILSSDKANIKLNEEFVK